MVQDTGRFFLLRNRDEMTLRPPTWPGVRGRRTAATNQRALSNQINVRFHEPHETASHLQSISQDVWTLCNLQFKHQRAVKEWKLGIWVCVMESCAVETGWVKSGRSCHPGGLNRTPASASCLSVDDANGSLAALGVAHHPRQAKYS